MSVCTLAIVSKIRQRPHFREDNEETVTAQRKESICNESKKGTSRGQGTLNGKRCLSCEGDGGETETARVGQKLGIGQKNVCDHFWRRPVNGKEPEAHHQQSYEVCRGKSDLYGVLAQSNRQRYGAHLTVFLKAMGRERYGVKQRPKKFDEQRRTERIWRKELTETNEWNRFSDGGLGEWWVIAASTVSRKRPLYAEMHP
ncbi:hypothetical protein GGX14DRAFT_402560 [Mycena pura]|uniref:Uncharacterized protein n=1 Tax=Mycena pura TaxID=153505 RepID=A0AAD6Y7B5_9AGAR|nr:hypothetical protein GGX14DRAFT_402560 [Mycena pura]